LNYLKIIDTILPFNSPKNFFYNSLSNNYEV